MKERPTREERVDIVEWESGELVNDARENGRSVSSICRNEGLQGVSSSKAKKEI